MAPSLKLRFQEEIWIWAKGETLVLVLSVVNFLCLQEVQVATGIILTRGGEMVCRSKTWLLAPAWGYWASALSGWASQIPIHLT